VFAASDEKLSCFGEANVQVAIVGDDGQSLTLDTNSAGNFSYEGALTFPLHVKVVRGAHVNEMLSAVTSGDCNGCHDETGQQGAPGRIVAP